MSVSEKVLDLDARARASDGTTASALRRVRARIIEVDTKKANNAVNGKGSEAGASQAQPEEPFMALAQEGRIIEPPFDMFTLALLPEHSSELNQCIDAMETNIAGTGQRFVSRLKIDEVQPSEPGTGQDGTESGGEETGQIGPRASAPSPEEQKLLAAARAERVKLINFFEYATHESFTEFKRKLRHDIEATGNSYFEVIRNASNQIQGFTHIPAYQIRIGRLDDDHQKTKRKILELQPDGSVQVKEIDVFRRFRRFVQSRAIHRRHLSTLAGHKVVWFKEFGDARTLNKRTGEFSDDTPEADRATELVHARIYSSRSPYGLPRYVGNLLSIFGDRASEEINYITFRNNNIPSMIIMASNGQLTEGSIKRIESFVESQIQGSDNYSKFLIIEGEPFGEEGEDGGAVKIDAKPLTSDQHKDALFQNYSKNNQDKIRRAFRLPPIFVGRSDDYTRATAESSRRLADEQIFAPERDGFDAIMNRFIFPDMGIIYHKFKSNSPNTTDNTQLVKILAGAEKTGGMTPRVARVMLEDILGIDLPDFPADFPADVPFSLTMAEAVKNEADTSEPGQTVTALKALGQLADQESLDDDDVAELGATLIKLNKAVEKMWRKDGDGAGEE